MFSINMQDFTRHEVKASGMVSPLPPESQFVRLKGEGYPAILPYALSRSMSDRDLEPEERTVRGALVNRRGHYTAGYLRRRHE